jgi:hypothetical protein
MNLRTLAREWLFLLAGLLWVLVLFPMIFSLLLPTKGLGWTFLTYIEELGNGSRTALIIAAGPYLLVQIVRLTVWSVRALRESK